MPDGRHAVSGAQSLYCECPAKTSSMITSKASISSPLVYFKKGDDFWCRFWLRMEDARPLGILDLECEWIEQHAGIRLLIDESGAFFVELKALDKPTFRQLQPRPVPLDKWVQVQLHWKLSEQSDGVVEVWQDQSRSSISVDKPCPLLQSSTVRWRSESRPTVTAQRQLGFGWTIYRYQISPSQQSPNSFARKRSFRSVIVMAENAFRPNSSWAGQSLQPGVMHISQAHPFDMQGKSQA